MKMHFRFVIPVSIILVSAITNIAAAQTCYRSSILSPTPFLGNDGEVFRLADGSFWEVKYEYEYLYEYYPEAVICPSAGKVIVAGHTLNVQALGSSQGSGALLAPRSSTVIESTIDGDFEGWNGDTIVKLSNGQIWQQTEYHYEYHYAFMPSVLIYLSGGQYKMKVDGTGQPIGVQRLR